MAGGLDHERWMSRALELAARAGRRASPNPMVGAVVLDAGGELAGEGFYEGYGSAHAEVAALRQAGERARGGTAYVTLEPHGFQGPHSAPCTDALIRGGVARLVAAMEDPDRRVSGDGFAQLRAAGIEVSVGVLEAEARRLNRFYVKQRATGRPFVTLKWAMSLDGRIATAAGESRWITGEAARAHAHRLRHEHDAILVGVNTVLADDPRLTVRLPDLPDARDPLRVVLDRRLRTPPDAKVLPALVFTARDAPAEARRRLEAAGAEVIATGTDPDQVLPELGRRELLSLLVEGGAEVLGSLSPHADAVACYVAPLLLGGRSARGAIGGGGFSLGAALRVEEPRLSRLGDDILIEADVHRNR